MNGPNPIADLVTRMRRDRARRALVLGFVLALLPPVACSDVEETPREGEIRSPASAAPPAATPARYATGLAFVGFEPGTPRLYFRFHNETTEESLLRTYRGWLSPGADGAWRRTFAFQDTLPTPRAAWRVLPAGDLGLAVTERGEISSLVQGDSSRRIRLLPDVRSAEWLGSTGQREGIGTAVLETANGRTEGLLLERREARPREIPVPPTVNRILLVTCGDDCGVLILRDEGVEESPTTAHAWLGGEARQEGVSLRSEGARGDGSASLWRFRLPELDVEGELSPGAIAIDSLPEVGAGLRVRTLEGTVHVRGESRPASGLLVESRGP